MAIPNRNVIVANSISLDAERERAMPNERIRADLADAKVLGT